MMKLTDKYVFFYTEWPSNFANTHFKWGTFGEEHEFFCTEQAFMWAKAKYFGDEEIASRILVADTPMDCKQLGRIVKGYDDKKWDLVRYNFMHDVNYEKYAQDKVLQKKIISNEFDGKIFVEASPTDCIWGIGLGENDPNIDDETAWNGTNLLGKVLTQVRAEIIHDFNAV